MKKLKIDKVYYVEWIDSSNIELRTSTGEEAPWIIRKTLDKRYSPLEFASIGLLISDKKNWILLAGSYDDDVSEVSCVQMIPKGCITHIERLYIKSYFKKKEGK